MPTFKWKIPDTQAQVYNDGLMSEKHKEILRRHRTELVKSLNVADFKDYLIEKNIIPEDMFERIMLQPGRTRQVSEFLDLIVRRGSNAFDTFLESIKDSYDFLYARLHEEAKSDLTEKIISFKSKHNNEHYYYAGIDVLKMIQDANFKSSKKIPDDDDDDDQEVYDTSETCKSIDMSTRPKFPIPKLPMPKLQTPKLPKLPKLPIVAGKSLEEEGYFAPTVPDGDDEVQYATPDAYMPPPVKGTVPAQQQEEETYIAVVTRDVWVYIYSPGIEATLHKLPSVDSGYVAPASPMMEKYFTDLQGSQDDICGDSAGDELSDGSGVSATHSDSALARPRTHLEFLNSSDVADDEGSVKSESQVPVLRQTKVTNDEEKSERRRSFDENAMYSWDAFSVKGFFSNVIRSSYRAIVKSMPTLIPTYDGDETPVVSTAPDKPQFPTLCDGDDTPIVSMAPDTPLFPVTPPILNMTGAESNHDEQSSSPTDEQPTVKKDLLTSTPLPKIIVHDGDTDVGGEGESLDVSTDNYKLRVERMSLDVSTDTDKLRGERKSLNVSTDTDKPRGERKSLDVSTDSDKLRLTPQRSTKIKRSSTKRSSMAGMRKEKESKVGTLKLPTNSNAPDRSNMIELKKGDNVIVKTNQVPIAGYLKVHNISGKPVMVPTDCIKAYDDPTDEPWFYPVNIKSQAASTLLKRQSMGTYIFYKASNNSPYNMSMVCDQKGLLKHFQVNTYGEGCYGFDEEEIFQTLHDLQAYYVKNRGLLPCRLRRVPSNEPSEVEVTRSIQKEHIIETDEICFEPCSNVGKGISGQVKKAVYNDEEVAVKTLQVTDKSPAILEDFLNEAQTLLELKHENIISCHGINISDNMDMIIVMELCSKRDVRQCLKTGDLKAVQDGERFLDLFKQIVAALDYLKSKGIIHRDIATRNVFLTCDYNVKLGDFGMARSVIDDVYRAEDHESVPVRWAPPEVLSELRFSSKSDIYAAGVTLWEMYSNGRKPYDHLSGINLTKAISRGELLEQPYHCPTEIYDIMTMCWARKPTRRPSAEQLRKKLNSRNYYTNEDCVAKTTSDGRRPSSLKLLASLNSLTVNPEHFKISPPVETQNDTGAENKINTETSETDSGEKVEVEETVEKEIAAEEGASAAPKTEDDTREEIYDGADSQKGIYLSPSTKSKGEPSQPKSVKVKKASTFKKLKSKLKIAK